MGRGTVLCGSEAKDSRKGKATDKCVGVGRGASRRRAWETMLLEVLFPQVGSKVF